MFKKITLLALLIVFLFSGVTFAQVYERNETLYTSGTQWGPPSSWNPYNTGGYAMGTFGLCYESLFLYGPLTNEYIPWLAESGEWISSKVYELKIRKDVKWNDGTMFTAKDVKFTFDIAKTAAIGLSPIWNFLGSVDKVDDYTVQLKFDDPLYQELGWYIYNNPIIPEHIWASKSTKDVTSGIGENPVGTGAYMFEASDQSKMVWTKNPNWWANSALGLDPKPKYIIDLVNSSNNVALGQVIMGQYDLNNNFLPGIASIVEGGYGISTYFPDPPYMIAGNTAWLLLNLTKKPMDDVAFRQAVAHAIDVDQIVNVVYGKIVAKADPSGLLPIWDQYIDKELVQQLGFSYNPEKAKAILKERKLERERAQASSNAGYTGSASVSSSAIVNKAYQYLGVKYVWGGTSPSGFDCSGFIQYVYGTQGISLPRTSRAQAASGKYVSIANAQPGDILYFGQSSVTHVGIYIGNGKMIHSPRPGKSVEIVSISWHVNNYRIQGARRI